MGLGVVLSKLKIPLRLDLDPNQNNGQRPQEHDSMIIQAIYEEDFRNMFKQFSPDHFSYDALSSLYDYLSEWGSEDDYVMDVVELVTTWTEYDSIDDALKAYSNSIESFDDLLDHTIVLYTLSGSVVILNF